MSGESEQYEGTQLAANANQLQLARGVACSAAGCVAGVLGLNWMSGFLLYCAVAVAMGFAMFAATGAVAARQKPVIERKSYIPSTITYFTQGLFPSLMVCPLCFFFSFDSFDCSSCLSSCGSCTQSFILFWALFANLVFVY